MVTPTFIIEPKKIKKQLGFEKLKIADRKKVEKQAGYPVGCIPLVGLGIPCVFDKKLLCHDFVYGGTGNELLTLKINPKDLLKVNEIKGMFTDLTVTEPDLEEVFLHYYEKDGETV